MPHCKCQTVRLCKFCMQGAELYSATENAMFYLSVYSIIIMEFTLQ